ncbi:DMT family transporter [Acidisoma sp. 7E03]
MAARETLRATAFGCTAIVFWAGLALLTAATHGIPPFELLALSFGVAFVVGSALLALRGREALARLRQPVLPWVTAFLALFLYHALYFYALATIPPARASLIAYLWPLLIVLFSAMLPHGPGLKIRHLGGTGMGLVGVGFIFTGHGRVIEGGGSVLGYLAAIGCAVVWSSYTVINRRFARVPSEMLIGVCAAVSLAGATAHILLEQTVWPASGQWGAIVLLGIGPTGLAFLAWDHATKHGDLPLLGALSYLAPLISTLLLVLAGKAVATLTLGLAACLIVGGAVLATWHGPSAPRIDRAEEK